MDYLRNFIETGAFDCNNFINNAYLLDYLIDNDIRFIKISILDICNKYEEKYLEFNDYLICNLFVCIDGVSIFTKYINIYKRYLNEHKIYIINILNKSNNHMINSNNSEYLIEQVRNINPYYSYNCLTTRYTYPFKELKNQYSNSYLTINSDFYYEALFSKYDEAMKDIYDLSFVNIEPEYSDDDNDEIIEYIVKDYQMNFEELVKYINNNKNNIDMKVIKRFPFSMLINGKPIIHMVNVKVDSYCNKVIKSAIVENVKDYQFIKYF